MNGRVRGVLRRRVLSIDHLTRLLASLNNVEAQSVCVGTVDLIVRVSIAVLMLEVFMPGVPDLQVSLRLREAHASLGRASLVLSACCCHHLD